MDQHPGLDVALVCTPHSGHALPTIHVARALARRGHRARLFTCDWAVEEFGPLVKEAGAEIFGLRCAGGLTKQKLQEMSERQIFALSAAEPMQVPLAEALRARRPDVVVSDFGAVAGMRVAEELGIPLVVNMPGPVALARDALGLMDTSTHRSFGGLHLGLSGRGPFAFVTWMNIKFIGDWFAEVRRHLAGGAVLLINSFWGMDEPMALPPNIVVTGPLLPPAVDLRSALQASHPELCDFLAGAGGEAIYVTTGSTVELKAWQVEALYEGLKRTGRKVVWSLKKAQQAMLPCASDPDFYISSWTPQAELLQHEAINVVVTHCGWGGALETILAGRPIIAMPFCGDQPQNAQLLVTAGVGEPVGKIPKTMGKERNPYSEGDFTADTVHAAAAKILDGYEAYERAAGRLRAAAQATGGPDLAVQHIEWAARLGTAHRTPPHLAKTMGSSYHSGLAVAAAYLAAGLAVSVGVAVTWWRQR